MSKYQLENYGRQIFNGIYSLTKESKNYAKKYCEESIKNDANSQLIKYLKQIIRQFQISNQKLCTWVSQGGYRRYHQGLCPYDG